MWWQDCRYGRAADHIGWSGRLKVDDTGLTGAIRLNDLDGERLPVLALQYVHHLAE